MIRRLLAAGLTAALAIAGPAAAPQEPVALFNAAGSLKFAVIGDNGTGKKPQYEVGTQMAATRAQFPFELVIMLGDNMYGGQTPKDFVDKFERPYAELLAAKVLFFAALGNHDRPDNRFYKGFNMGGERYYTFARNDVRFFVFDTNLMDRAQLAWIENTLRGSREPWKIAYFHHPLYSNGGRHGSNVELRVVLEPMLVRHGVSVVFAGHDHIYERLKPQKGITHFVAGSGGQLRKGDLSRSATTAAGFDQDRSFMLVEISGDVMTFRAISRTGATVDSGVIGRRPTT
jgi:3',5'-cyclic AMP phosphodiesterase CpdA